MGVYFENCVKPGWSKKTANNNKIKVFSALIKENITISSEDPGERFKIISFGIGTKYQSCCLEGITCHICDGHAESLCYYAAPIYFQTQLKRITETTLFYLTKDGYVVKPYYKFHLLISRPPCGFMSDDKKSLWSWKTPFHKQPHIPECSSKILINSYLGIQGPLTTIFAKPIYITDIIILKYPEIECRKTSYAVFANAEEIEQKLEGFKILLQKNKRFCFTKPNVIVHRLKTNELKELFDDTLCDFTLEQEDSTDNCAFSIPTESNERQLLLTMTKIRKKQGNEKIFETDKQEKLAVEDLWKYVQEKFLMTQDHKQFQHRYHEILDTVKELSFMLKIKTSLQEVKNELEDRIKQIEQAMISDLGFINTDFYGLYIEEKEYTNTQELEKGMNSRFINMPKKLEEKKNKLTLIKLVDNLSKQDLQLFDCTWKKYIKLLSNLMKETQQCMQN